MGLRLRVKLPMYKCKVSPVGISLKKQRENRISASRAEPWSKFVGTHKESHDCWIMDRLCGQPRAHKPDLFNRFEMPRLGVLATYAPDFELARRYWNINRLILARFLFQLGIELWYMAAQVLWSITTLDTDLSNVSLCSFLSSLANKHNEW